MRTSKLEKELHSQGYIIAGLDEVGCGSLAGPVVAAAVILPVNCKIGSIADSKALSPTQREKIFYEMMKAEIPIAWGVATVSEVEKYNVRQASIMAMKRALDLLPLVTYALVDAWKIPHISIEQKGIIKGDATIRCIAAASIAAKVVRDYFMTDYGKDFPEYEFDRHKGYGTAFHIARIREFGATKLHRRTFLKSVLSDSTTPQQKLKL